MEMWSQLGAPSGLVPDFEETVPRPSRHCHTILSNAKTADTIVMPSEHTCMKKMKKINYYDLHNSNK